MNISSRKVYPFLLVLFLIVTTSCSPPATTTAPASAADSKHTLEGTWELVSAKYTFPDKTETNAGYKQIKVITKNHWAFVGQNTDRQKFTSQGSDAELLSAAKGFGAGGGTYTFSGDTYTEVIEFFHNPNYVGLSIPWNVKWDGDQFIQSGTFPIKAAGMGENDMQLYEVWKRIE